MAPKLPSSMLSMLPGAMGSMTKLGSTMAQNALTFGSQSAANGANTGNFAAQTSQNLKESSEIAQIQQNAMRQQAMIQFMTSLVEMMAKMVKGAGDAMKGLA